MNNSQEIFAIENTKTAKILGLLFLAVMVTWTAGYSMIGDVLNAQTYLTEAFPKRNQLFIGVLLELVEIGSIIGIAVVMFPLIKKLSERMAVWYFGFRIIESAILLVGVFCALIMITLSQNYLNMDASDLVDFHIIGDLVINLRTKWIHLILPFFYSSAGVVFFYFFYKSKLIPRFISIAGLVGALLVMIAIPFDFFELKLGLYIGSFMGITELFLGLWLLAKGFK